MGLINSISNWKSERYEKHKSYMKSQGRCPECHGRGFTTSLSVYSATYDCPGCNGSGLYSDWIK